MKINLYDYQREAVDKMHNGCILNGSVGSGKSRTSLAYYFEINGGVLDPYHPMKHPQKLYIITTARKRDTLEWEKEIIPFNLSNDISVIVDSWNNIKNYINVKDSFFIFDEQRVVGTGSWVKSFLNITKTNKWILLSATPGDKWSDYAPVFIANGFYKNITDFRNKHVVYSKFTKYPKIDRYLDTGILMRFRNDILVNMNYRHEIIKHNTDVYADYDLRLYKHVRKERWNVYENKPIQNASELCYILRKIINSDESRINAIKNIVDHKHKVIIFYNFNYELDLLKSVDYGKDVKIAEWNGHNHNPIPDSKKWVYLVQYTSGSEGWNCILTDTIIFYSQNYSYRITTQAAGRIDRLNTPFTDLYYYHLKSRADIDIAISRALKRKEKFNERKWCNDGQ